LKVPAPKKKRREIFVLTPEEKRTVAFVLAALLLGIGAKRYRASHSPPPLKTAIVETARSADLPAQKRAEAKRRKLAK
jgi:hypothetical protein